VGLLARPEWHRSGGPAVLRIIFAQTIALSKVAKAQIVNTFDNLVTKQVAQVSYPYHDDRMVEFSGSSVQANNP